MIQMSSDWLQIAVYILTIFHEFFDQKKKWGLNEVEYVPPKHIM
jgi:hypothetical protein